MAEPWTAGRTLPDQMRRHARDAHHLYGYLMRAMADDYEAGGSVRAICAGYEEAPAGWVVQLRLLAGLFRIVLTDRAPQLVPFYPCLGGGADPAAAWPDVRQVLAANADELHEALSVAPQTNEVGRANALLVGMFLAVRRTGCTRVRLLEPGSSGGLNLLLDRFRFINQGWAFGPEESPVVLRGGVAGEVQPVPFEIVDRRGCDVSPVDVTSYDGQLRLRSFVWPFHVERHERLAGALRLAQETPPVVDEASAADWLEQRLDERVDADVLTVVWQSITRQYWPVDEVGRADAVIAEAARRSPLAHVSMEYPDVTRAFQAELSVACSEGGGTGALTAHRLGTVGDHGFPVDLDRP